MIRHRRSPIIPRKTLVLVLLVLLLPPLAGSRCRVEGPRVAIEDDTRPLYFEQIVRGQQGRLSDTTETVIKDSETWDAYKQRLRVPINTGVVDFDQMMVILAAVPVESGGYDVSFRSVEEADSLILAHYVLGVPGDDCITTMGLTVPFQAVAVRRVDVPVVFERVIERVQCTFR